MKPPVKLFVLRYPPALGGVERYVADIHSRADTFGVSTRVVTTDLADHQTFRRLTDVVPSAGVRRLPVKRLPNSGYPIVSGLREELRGDPDAIVHAHAMYYPMHDAALMMARGPLILNPHTYLRGGRKARFYRRLLAQLYARRRPHLVADSAFEADLLMNEFAIPAERIDVVPPLIQGFGPVTSPGGIQHVVAVGRLDEGKGFGDLLSAMERGSWPGGVALTILGASSIRAGGLVSQASLITGYDVRVVVDASDQEVARAVSTADLFVTPSRWEAFGIAAVQACASGVPVVGYDVGALPRLLPGEDATFVPLQDVEALCLAVAARLQVDRDLRVRTDRASRYVDRFGATRWDASWAAIYEAAS